MIDSAPLTAFGLGLAGAGHCLGMCGGIAAALNPSGDARLATTLAYHAGRLLSYSTLGGLLGFAAGSIDFAAWTVALRYLAALLLVGMGLYITGWWRGMLLLERAGAHLWRPVQKLAAPLLPPRHPYQAGLLGLCWGMMPCGLIYSSLAWAATAQQPAVSALLMLCFGLGTLPAMLATSIGAQQLHRLLRSRGWRSALGILVILSGLWTAYIALAHGTHAGHQAEPQASPAAHQHHH